jgi:tetratricopeptide (TPR) repeat protein
MLWALPVIVALLPIAAIGGWTMIRGTGGFVTQYNLALKAAREEKDYERVRLYQLKLAQLGADTEFTDYQTALALAKDGDVEQAYVRMQQLAPDDRAGYLPAHSWIIEQLVSENLELSADERQRLLKLHLDHAQTLGAKGDTLRLLRAVTLVQERKIAEAVELLEPLATRMPPAATMRMDCNIALNRLDDARRDARTVRLHMEDRTRNGATLSPQEYRSWTVAEDLLGNLTKAHSLAEQWHRLEPEDATARGVLIDLSQRMFQDTLALPNPDSDRLTELFLQAAELADDPKALQEQITLLYRMRAEYPLAQRLVEEVLSSPRAPAAILEAAGTIAATFGETDKAQSYLQRAVQKDPRNAVAWNNYAWLVAHDPNGDLENALQAVNTALEIRPNDIRFRETRGQVLVRLGRWKESIEDLEFAANGLPQSRDIHLSLAKAYDALGDRQLARVHREHAGSE